MAQDIIKNIPLALDINAKKRLNGTIDIQLYSKDIATGQFEFSFIDEDGKAVVLDESYSAQALVKFEGSTNTYLDDMVIEGSIIRFIFPHDFITRDGTVTMYIYITKGSYTSDVAAISFPVFLSEIDKNLDRSVAVHYIGQIEKLIQDMKDEMSSYQVDVDEIIEGYEESISKLQALETNYEPQLQELTTQLAQTDLEARRKKDLEDLTPRVLDAIAGGQETSFNLLSIPQDDSVDWTKTTFVRPGKNVFNKNDMLDGYALNSMGDLITSGTGAVTDFIRYTQGQTPSFSYGDTINRTPLPSLRIVVYDADFNKLEVLSNFTSGSVISTSGAKYFRANLSSTVAKINFQIEYGAVTEYEEYYLGFTDDVKLPESNNADNLTTDDLRNWRIETEQVAFINSGTNKFNVDAVKDGFGLSSLGDEITNESQCISDFIQVVDGTKVFLGLGNAEFSARMVLYNSKYEKIHTYVMFESGTTINNPNVAFFRVALTKVVAYNSTMQINFGEFVPFEKFRLALDDEIKVKASNITDGGAGTRLKGKQMVAFGDSITQDSNERSHYPTYFEAMTGVRYVNQGYGGTTMSRHVVDDFRPFSMTYLLQAKLANDYTAQEAVITKWEAGTSDDQLRAGNYRKQMDKFKALDFNNLYAITMLYGANDHGYTIGDITSVDPDGATFIGAYNHVIKTLQENYPKLGIVLITPIYRDHAAGVEDRTPLFVQAVKDIAKANNLPCYDAYQNLGFNKYNWRQYYSTDGLHPIIETGQPRMGERIASWLNSVI